MGDDWSVLLIHGGSGRLPHDGMQPVDPGVTLARDDDSVDSPVLSETLNLTVVPTVTLATQEKDSSWMLVYV